MKCAICGDDNKKSKMLASGVAICDDCHEETLEVVECETCGELVWTKDARNMDGTTECLSCIEKWVKEEALNVTLEEMNEERVENGEVLWTVEEFQAWQAEYAEENFDLTRTQRQIVKRLIGEGWGLKEAV